MKLLPMRPSDWGSQRFGCRVQGFCRFLFAVVCVCVCVGGGGERESVFRVCLDFKLEVFSIATLCRDCMMGFVVHEVHRFWAFGDV